MAHGFRLIPVTVDGEGVQVSGVEQKEEESGCPGVAFETWRDLGASAQK